MGFFIYSEQVVNGACFREEFPVWGTVYHYFRSWDNAGVWTYVQRTLYEMTRIQAGRNACPSVVIIWTALKLTIEAGNKSCQQLLLQQKQVPHRQTVVVNGGMLLV
jgi:transposase